MSIVAAAAVAASARVRVTVGPAGVPSVPQNLSATAASASQINLSWSSSTGSPTHYNIYRQEEVPALEAWIPTTFLIATSATNSYSDTGLQGLTRYQYWVSAENGSGESDLSTPDTADTDAPASTIWVGTAATGDQSGSDQDNLATLATAAASATAGTMVVLLGGTYTRTTALAPANSGTSGNRIIYKAAPGQTPVLTGAVAANIDPCLNLNGKSWLKFDGISIDGAAIPGLNRTQAAFRRWMFLTNAHNIEICNCTMQYANNMGIETDDVNANGSTFIWLHHNSFDHVGTMGEAGTADAGECVKIQNGGHWLIEHNVFRHGGHNLFLIQEDGPAPCDNTVVRYNDFYNYWGDIAGYEAGGAFGYTAGAGQAANRCMVLSDSSRCVLEWNVLRFVRRSSDTTTPNLLKTEGENHIVRRNILFDTSSDGFSQVPRTASPLGRNVHHYHNSLWGIGTSGPGGAAWTVTLGAGGDGANGGDNVFKNNAVNNCNSPQIFLSLGDGSTIRNNIIQGNAFCPATGQNMRFVGTTDTVQNWDDNDNVDANLVTASPGWVGGAAPTDFAGFQLDQGSTLIDAGQHLTVTVGAGTNSTSMTVADAGYFCDGFGIPQLQGDEIMTASGETARITAINYGTNVLTLDTAISWSAGEGVSQPFTGSAPDIGAREVGIDVPAS